MSENKNTPELKALILAGGASTRMGKDKSQIELYGLPQEKYLKFLCELLGLDTYLSKREGNGTDMDKIILDQYEGKGPIVGIASALKKNPDCAWLVIACDLPLLNLTEIQHLIENRDTTKLATALKSRHKAYPEPLICIWEPRSRELILETISNESFCPRKLLESRIKEVEAVAPINEESIANANTPEELQQIMEFVSVLKDVH